MKNLTGTKNIFINSLIIGACALIVYALTALCIGCIVDPSLIENASYSV